MTTLISPCSMSRPSMWYMDGRMLKTCNISSTCRGNTEWYRMWWNTWQSLKNVLPRLPGQVSSPTRCSPCHTSVVLIRHYYFADTCQTEYLTLPLSSPRRGWLVMSPLNVAIAEPLLGTLEYQWTCYMWCICVTNSHWLATSATSNTTKHLCNSR